MARFGFVGPTYESQSLRADAQKCQNWYPEPVESGDGASVLALYPRWGQTPFASLAGTKVRGLFEYNGRCFGVGDNFAELFADGHIAGYTFLPVDSNPVSMAANNSNELIICTAGQLWLFPLAPGSIIYNDVSLNDAKRLHFGKKLAVDSANERIVGDAAGVANPMLTRDYRKPFVVPSEKDV